MNLTLTIALVLGLLAALMLVVWLQNQRTEMQDRRLLEEQRRGNRDRGRESHRHRAGSSHRYRRDDRRRRRDEHEGYDPDGYDPDEADGTVGTLLAIDAMDGALDGRLRGDYTEPGAPGSRGEDARRPRTVPIDEALDRAGIGAEPGTGEPVQRTGRPETVPIDEALQRAGLLGASDPTPAPEPAPAPKPEPETGNDWGGGDSSWGGDDSGWGGDGGGGD